MIKLISQLLIIFALFSCSSDSNEKQATLNWQTQQKKLLDDNNSFLKIVESDLFQFQNLEIVYVSIGDAYYSWLGHIFIRFQGSAPNPKDDISLSYLIIFDSDKVDNLKAYYGGYNAFPLVNTWDYFVNDYIKKEKRYIQRYQLDLNHQQKHAAIKQLRKMMKNPLDIGEFSFRRKNCTHYPMQFLAQIGLDVDKDKTTFPINFIHYLTDLKLFKSKSQIISLKNIGDAYK